MYGENDIYSSFVNPVDSAQSFRMPVDSEPEPEPSASYMAMQNVSRSIEIPNVFAPQVCHTHYPPHITMNVLGVGLGPLREPVLLSQPVEQVMSPQCQAIQSFAINENVSNSAFCPQNCANPNAFPPQDCPNPEVKGSEIAGDQEGVEEEEVKKNSKESVQKKRAKNWTKVEISRLAKLRCEMQPRFEKGAKKAELWEEIAEALKGDVIYRDSQQCRDKWEKFIGAYKGWLRDGGKPREDNSLFEELKGLLEGKTPRRETEQCGGEAQALMEEAVEERFLRGCQFIDEEEIDVGMANLAGSKRRRPSYLSVSDIFVVKELVGTVMESNNRKMFELLEARDRREQARLEKEEKWRAEDLAWKKDLNNALSGLLQNLVGDHPRNGVASTAVAAQAPRSKKRSRNWKAQEVRELIKVRGEMDCRFTEGHRRGPLWEELSKQLVVKGVHRGAKQCKEKWDKLVSDYYKEVVDEKKEAASSPFFEDMQAILMPQNYYLENVRPENISTENVHPENISTETVNPENIDTENVHPENTFVDNVNPQ